MYILLVLEFILVFIVIIGRMFYKIFVENIKLICGKLIEILWVMFNL
jgi:hypothetical protein